MEPHDDPEARIRALEQPLADNARATELGTTPYTAPNDAYLPPPLPPMPPHARAVPAAGLRRSVGAAAAEVVGGNSVGDLRGGRRPVPGRRRGRRLLHREQVDAGDPEHPRRQHPEHSVHAERMPNMPSQPTAAPPGGQISVAGVGETKTITCNDNGVSVSGVSNTVTITGHCTTVTVSGMQNKVTLDESDQINASGFDNVVTFHSGSPDVNSGGSNVVQQG